MSQEQEKRPAGQENKRESAAGGGDVGEGDVGGGHLETWNRRGYQESMGVTLAVTHSSGGYGT